jgi:glutaredoxin
MAGAFYLRVAVVVIALFMAFGSRSLRAADMVAFVREGCVYCERAKSFLDSLQIDNPDFSIEYRDVIEDPAAAQLLMELTVKSGADQAAVPTFWIGDGILIGFGGPETTGEEIRGLLGIRAAGDATIRSERFLATRFPFLGEISVERQGLLLFTVLLGLLDGFNPCAMWVLLFLLSMLVHLNDRRRMAAIAAIFVLVSGLVYFAFMAAWLNFFFLVGITRTVQVIIGLAGLTMAAINLKDFFAFQKGTSLTISPTMKSWIGSRIRRVVTAENFVSAVAGVVVLAVLVNFVELMCTAGLPAIYTQVLASQEIAALQHYFYLGLYNVAYILDDGSMVTIAVVGLSHARVRESTGRYLKLVSGGVMLILALLLLFKPEWLDFSL